MIKKAVALLFLGILLQTGTVQAGNYSKCSNACSAAKCKNKSIAEQCAEWCEGIPALEAVFNACKAKQPVAEHAGLDAKHLAEQVKHGRAPGGGGGGGAPLAALPAAYNAGAVQAFCQAYHGNRPQMLADHGADLLELTSTQDGFPIAPGGVRIVVLAGGNNARVMRHRQPNADFDIRQLHDMTAAPSAPAALAAGFNFFDAVAGRQAGLIIATGAAPAPLINKGLCYFE